MTARVLVVAGTGTDVGKTHVGEALLRAVPGAPPDGRRLAVWKPYESGVSEGVPSDSERLGAAVAHRQRQLPGEIAWLAPPLRRLRRPLAPPIAAALDGRPLDQSQLEQTLAALVEQADLLMVELAGGLFAPLTDQWLGLDLARHVSRATVLVLAPNRLGVLHDAIATVRAAEASGVGVSHLALVEVSQPDPASAHNAAALAAWLPAATRLHRLPYAALDQLAGTPQLRTLAQLVL